MADPCPAVDQVLEALRQEFIQEATAECRWFMARLRAGEMERLRLTMHRWAGVAGSLGCPAITEAARELESLLRRTPPPAQSTVQIRLEEMARLLRRAASSSFAESSYGLAPPS